MMNDRIILHSDMNCFYASVEMLLYPELKGKPMAVCGSTKDRHGIILAKSEEAKRAGVKTGMVCFEAMQLCPGLILRAPRYEQYIKFSGLAKKIYERYTDYIEPFGMDEVWLDVTGSAVQGDGPAIAESIRNAIRTELGLTVSIGVSWNKIFAKLGSDMKKPDAVTVISRENYREKVWPLNAGELLYVGRATEAKLRSRGIHTIGDIAVSDPVFLKRLLGINGEYIHGYASGTDSSRVMHKDTLILPESAGHGVTCISDLVSDEEVRRVMLALSQDIGSRLRALRCLASGVKVFIRDSGLSFTGAQMLLPQATRSPEDITRCAFSLYRQKFCSGSGYGSVKIRQVTIDAYSLIPDTSPVQSYLFCDQDYSARREKAEAAVDDIRRRFGKSALFPASLLLENKIPHDGRHSVRMPSLMYR